MHLWTSYLLGALLVLGSVGLFLTAPDATELARDNTTIQAAIGHFERNPDVRVNPRFVPFIGADAMAETRARHEKRKQQGGVAVLSERMQAKTQKRFDDLQRKAFASLQELPSWRFGLVDRASSMASTFTHLVVNDGVVQIGVSLLAIGLAAVMLEAAWGSLLLAGLCLLLPIVTRVTYLSLYGDAGIPWIGASGLAAGLLGAYLVRSFGGLTIPAWFVAPVWLGAEYLFARDLPIDSFDPAPLVVHGVCLGFGAAYAGVVQVSGLDGRHAARKAETEDLLSNPALEQALAARDAGNEDEAFDLLKGEIARSPGNHDAAVALWRLASGGSRAQAAANAIVGSIRDALRSGRLEDACSLWSAMAVEVTPRAEATLLVRLGEALLSQEEHEAALQAFGLALGGSKPLSSVLALRVVRGTRDLDSEMAARAAAVALADDQLALADRNAMQAVADAAGVRPAAEPAAAAAPGEAPAPAPTAPGPASAGADPDPYQDPHAIAADAFEELPEGESLAAEDPSQWNQPGMVEDLSSELEDEEPGFDWSGLQEDEGAGPAEPTGADTNVVLDDASAAGLEDDASEISETTETLDEDPDPTSGAEDAGLEIGDDDLAAAALETPARSLLTREAIPVALDAENVTIEVEGGSKTQLPLARIEAVAAGAVRGLADKPVLVVDLVLNWLEVPDEPLKVVRFRSDRFDPRAIVPDAGSALEAMRGMLDRLVAQSGGAPLPSRDAALGNPFASFDDLAAYGREVLMVQG